MIGQVMLALAILITLHELGHFAAARFFGIKVEKFYLFFDAWGVKLFKFKRGDTEYGIGWLPLGGYVKIAGMIDESLDKEQLEKDPEPWEFRSKPAWQRLIVMVGGVFVNLILGIFIYAMSLYYYGDTYIPIEEINKNGGIYATDFGQELGFQTGDQLLRINGDQMVKLEDFFKTDIMLHEGVTVDLERNGRDTTILMPSDLADRFSARKRQPPFTVRYLSLVDSVLKASVAQKSGLQKNDLLTRIYHNNVAYPVRFQDDLMRILDTFKNQSVEVEVVRNEERILLPATLDSTGRLGFGLADIYTDHLVKVHFGFFESFAEGNRRSLNTIQDNIKGLGQIFSGKIKATNAVQGPIAIAGLFGKKWDWQRFWYLTAVLSLILAFMNMLPIPALDGGHVVFLLIEMIIGKPINDKIMHAAQLVGMILLISLMVFVFGNDLFNIFK